MPLSLAQMRRNYTLGGLREERALDDPLLMFGQWLEQARETESPPVEANSMHLATVDPEGRPHCRVLLLKGVNHEGFTFFGNYLSAKGLELAANPHAAMTFFWPGPDHPPLCRRAPAPSRALGRLLPAARAAGVLAGARRPPA
nr:hypothetical protein FFPRI1PSEUD_32920 [Pseudomonas sp. FFPRI_1]